MILLKFDPLDIGFLDLIWHLILVI